MNASQVIDEVGRKFDIPAQAIITGCEMCGVHLRMGGEHLKAKGNRETIAAWQAMIQRHRPEIIAALAGTSLEVDFVDTLAADSEELTGCIMELCQLVGYSDEALDRMLAARCNLYPFQVATECAYFRWQVIRARTGQYWRNDVLRAGL